MTSTSPPVSPAQLGRLANWSPANRHLARRAHLAQVLLNGAFWVAILFGVLNQLQEWGFPAILFWILGAILLLGSILMRRWLPPSGFEQADPHMWLSSVEAVVCIPEIRSVLGRWNDASPLLVRDLDHLTAVLLLESRSTQASSSIQPDEDLDWPSVKTRIHHLLSGSNP